MDHASTNRVVAAAALVIAGVLTIGCEEEPVRSYTVAKPTPRPEPAPAAAGPSDALPGWVVPDGWTRAEQNPPMVRAMFFAPADGNEQAIRVTVVSLPGEAGGDLANVNRWRGQIGLPPVVSIKDAGVTEIALSGGAAKRVNIVQPAGAAGPRRMLVAWALRDGMTWFIKMTGPADAVSSQSGAFDTFVGSIAFGEGA